MNTFMQPFFLNAPTIPEKTIYLFQGIVTDVETDGIATVEGNTNPAGGRDGYGVFARRRSSSLLYRFVRWAGAVGSG